MRIHGELYDTSENRIHKEMSEVKPKAMNEKIYFDVGIEMDPGNEDITTQVGRSSLKIIITRMLKNSPYRLIGVTEIKSGETMRELIIGEGMTIHKGCTEGRARYVKTEVIKSDSEVRIECGTCGSILERWTLNTGEQGEG